MTSDLAASVRQRLLNLAKATHRPFIEVLRYYGMERFLYRLSVSPYADKFVLKGGLMLQVWQGGSARPTMDVDFLGRLDRSADAIRDALRSVCRQDVEPDGLVFDAASMKVQSIIEDAIYSGIRSSFRSNLGKTQIAIRIDTGFGDIVIGAPREPQPYPTLLAMPAPVLLGYSRESTIAEKLQIMAKLGLANSRVKDYFDMWSLARQFDFDGEVLAEAMRQTFAQRRTELPRQVDGLTDAYASQPERVQQWRSFVERNRLTEAPMELGVVVSQLLSFLEPLIQATASGEMFSAVWRAPGPWQRA